MVIIASMIWFYTSVTKFGFIVPSNYSDVGFLWFRDVNDKGMNMAIPYVQYKLEYPPMIGAIIWLGQWISTVYPFVLTRYDTYMVVESILQYPFMIGTVYNIYLMCRKLEIDTNRIYLFLLTTLTFIIYGFYNWDFIVAYFSTLAIWFYLRKRWYASSLALTAGILTKFIPIAMAPAMFVCLPNNRIRLRFLIVAAAFWGAVNAPFAYLNFGLWLQTFTHTSGHQLQNTWISMLTISTGLGDVISGRNAGHFISLAIIGVLILYSLVLRDKTPLEKILMAWYAWFGVIYLFDPQMFIQLFAIVVLTPRFNFLAYRIADLLNGFIIIFYFIGSNHPELPSYLTDQLTPFGLVNTSAAIRQLIFLFGGYWLAFFPLRRGWVRKFFRGLLSPVTG